MALAAHQRLIYFLYMRQFQKSRTFEITFGKIKKMSFNCLKSIVSRIILIGYHPEKSRLIYGRI